MIMTINPLTNEACSMVSSSNSTPSPPKNPTPIKAGVEYVDEDEHECPNPSPK